MMAIIRHQDYRDVGNITLLWRPDALKEDSAHWQPSWAEVVPPMMFYQRKSHLADIETRRQILTAHCKNLKVRIGRKAHMMMFHRTVASVSSASRASDINVSACAICRNQINRTRVITGSNVHPVSIHFHREETVLLDALASLNLMPCSLLLPRIRSST